MAEFKHISPYELEGNPIRMIAKDWALATAADGTAANTMTISWGGVGCLWNKPVAFLFVRPQRHTFRFTEVADSFSLGFFDESYREALTYCGTVSGREEDKIAHCGFTTLYQDGIPYFAEADKVLLCRKLYAQDLGEQFALSPIVINQYPQRDYHRMYVGEIVDVLVKE